MIVELQGQGGRESLAGKALVEVPDEDLVDLVRTDPGVFQRLHGDPADQRFDVGDVDHVVVLADIYEGRYQPGSDDASNGRCERESRCDDFAAYGKFGGFHCKK